MHERRLVGIDLGVASAHTAQVLRADETRPHASGGQVTIVAPVPGNPALPQSSHTGPTCPRVHKCHQTAQAKRLCACNSTGQGGRHQSWSRLETSVAFQVREGMRRRILVIGPKDSANRMTRVAQALAAKRPDLRPTTPAEILGDETDWSAAYLNALADAAAVVCVLRPDATIGNGTLRDLVQAHEAGVEVRVVCLRGRLLGLEEAGLEVIPEPSTKAALSVWTKRAAWFSWTARALPTMFVVPRTGNG